MSDLLIFGAIQISTPKPNISSATITLGPSLTYTGSEQTQIVTSVVLGGTTLVAGTDYTVTDNTAISAGTYTLSVIAQGDYDGVATASWTIAKAAGSVSLDKTEISLDTSNVTDTITVTRAGNGTISAQSNDTSIATVSVNGNVVTVTGVATGNATITINVAAGDNYLATSATASVNIIMISSVLAENSPAEIQRAAQLGIGSQYWQVGDYTALISIDSFIDFPISTETRAFILGFDHNSATEGTGIHFQIGLNNSKYFAYCPTTYSVASTSTSYSGFIMRWVASTSSTNKTSRYAINAYGWSACKMRLTYAPAFKSALPLSWQNVIKQCTKYTNNSGKNSLPYYITSTEDDIFLLAPYEVFGTTSYTNSYESWNQRQYAFFENGNTKQRYNISNSSLSVSWWLRSPASSNSTNYLFVTRAGSPSTIGSNYPRAFAPAFVIG